MLRVGESVPLGRLSRSNVEIRQCACGCGRGLVSEMFSDLREHKYFSRACVVAAQRAQRAQRKRPWPEPEPQITHERSSHV